MILDKNKCFSSLIIHYLVMFICTSYTNLLFYRLYLYQNWLVFLPFKHE